MQQGTTNTFKRTIHKCINNIKHNARRQIKQYKRIKTAVIMQYTIQTVPVKTYQVTIYIGCYFYFLKVINCFTLLL